MALEGRKKQLESFVDFSANIGIAYVSSKFLAGIFGLLFNLVRRPLVSAKWYLGYVAPMWIRSPYDVYKRVQFFKQVGIQCPECGQWVSRDHNCPICGYDLPSMAQRNADGYYRVEVPAEQAQVIKQNPADVIDYVTRLWNLRNRYPGIAHDQERVRDDKYLVDAEYLRFVQDYRACMARFHINLYDASAAEVYYERYLATNATKLDHLVYIAQFILEWQPSHPGERVWRNRLAGTQTTAGHFQESTRNKYEKILCPNCRSTSISDTSAATDQRRTCTRCGHKFIYSYANEYRNR